MEMVVEMSGFLKQTRDSLLNLSGAVNQLNEGFNSVCAQFNNNKLLTESPKRKKASLAAVNTIMVSTPNPNLAAAAVSVDTGVSKTHSWLWKQLNPVESLFLEVWW